MSIEDLNQEEEVEKTNPTTESESDDASELKDLFADESQDEEADDVEALKKEIKDLKKGLSKFFSEQGRKAKQVEEPGKKAETKTVQTDDVSELFFTQVPQAEAVQEDLRKIADKLYNGSILKAWKGESWIQDKAKALTDEKAEDEANKSKIAKPSNGSFKFGNKFENVKSQEDIESMSSKQRADFLKYQAEKGN